MNLPRDRDFLSPIYRTVLTLVCCATHGSGKFKCFTERIEGRSKVECRAKADRAGWRWEKSDAGVAVRCPACAKVSDGE